MPAKDTIVGLSSGSLPAGLAVLRISGPGCKAIMEAHGVVGVRPRNAHLVSIHRFGTNQILDRGICLWFPGPESFTGEDCLEFQVHGGPAVVQAIIESILDCENTRLAEAGEFSRRAFENGKFDLTELEGLSDLLRAQTEEQRKQALAQSSGSLRSLYEGWRTELIRIQAMMEADIDFVEEDDIPEDVGREGLFKLDALKREMKAHLDDNRAGEIVRDGFRVIIMGAPNAGKSSLLNTLAKRDVAIVTNEPGTTRDILDVHLNIGGFEVIVSDSAGIRKTENVVEAEGIRRAREKSKEADLIIWLEEIDAEAESICRSSSIYTDLVLYSKDDGQKMPEGKSISSKTGYGIGWLINEMRTRIKSSVNCQAQSVISRSRHRQALKECIFRLDSSTSHSYDEIDLIVEDIRSAGVCLGKITGRIDVEDLLDVIFSEFCVGK